MNIQVRRISLQETYTIGKLSIDGKYECDTLEDKVREDGVKIFGETAIPSGKYEIVITYSQRFKIDLPLLLNVPNFEGIRIHPGNTDADTHGCILVGKNKIKGKVVESQVTFKALFAKIRKALDNGDKVFITIN